MSITVERNLVQLRDALAYSRCLSSSSEVLTCGIGAFVREDEV